MTVFLEDDGYVYTSSPMLLFVFECFVHVALWKYKQSKLSFPLYHRYHYSIPARTMVPEAAREALTCPACKATWCSGCWLPHHYSTWVETWRGWKVKRRLLTDRRQRINMQVDKWLFANSQCGALGRFSGGNADIFICTFIPRYPIANIYVRAKT